MSSVEVGERSCSRAGVARREVARHREYAGGTRGGADRRRDRSYRPEDLRNTEEACAAWTIRPLAEAKVRELLDAEERVESELREVSEETSRVEVQVRPSSRARSSRARSSPASTSASKIGSRLAHEFEIPPSRAKEEFPPAGDESP